MPGSFAVFGGRSHDAVEEDVESFPPSGNFPLPCGVAYDTVQRTKAGTITRAMQRSHRHHER